MRRYSPSIPVILLLTALSPLVAGAQELKIGYVDTARVLEEAPQAEAVDGKLLEEFVPREEALLQMQKEIADLEAELKREGSDMDSARRRKLEREIRQMVSQYRYEEQEFREDRNIRRNEEIRALQKVVYDTIVEISKRERFDLVLTNGVSYASSRTDLTDRVIEKLKQQRRQQGGGTP